MRGERQNRISRTQINVISERLVGLQRQIPSDFGRRPRSLDDVDRWKAVEYRQLLLYTGHIVLKDVLPERFYDHFMCLSVAICILVSSKLSAKYHTCAHQLLVYFVEQSKILYGDQFLVYNVHSLIHLSHEAVVHGSLENCSAWKFESFMQVLKKLVRSGKSPLAQTACHVSESSLGPTVFRGPRNFEPSRGIWLLPRNCRVSAEFHGILRKHGNSEATAILRKSVLL